MNVDIERVINQPIDRVFVFMSDLARRPEWVTPALERTKTTDGPIGVGTKYNAVDRLPGRRLEFVHEITAYEPNGRFAESWDGSMPGRSEAILSEEGGATKVSLHMAMDMPAFMRLLEPLIKLWVKRAMAKDFARFEQLVASEG